MIRLFLIEAQRLSREGLRVLVEQEVDMQVVAEADSMTQAAAGLRAHQADVVVLDIESLGGNVRQAVKAIHTAHADARVVVLAAKRSDELIGQALQAGVLGFVLKDEGFEQVREAIRAAHAGRHHYSRPVRDRLHVKDEELDPGTTRTRLQRLTPRELQLLRLLASGLSLKNACKTLHVSYKTADKHKVNLMRKLGIHDRVELARYAIREKLIEA